MKRAAKRRTRSIARFLAILVVLVSVLGSVAASYVSGARQPQRETPALAERGDGTGWRVGQLRDDGLRIEPSGPSDSTAVLDPGQFTGTVRNAYSIATQIPEVLNQLYCWCGCIEAGQHRSNLQCFEDTMSVTCEVCQRTAEIAHDLVKQGVRDVGKIQARVDEELASPTASATGPHRRDRRDLDVYRLDQRPDLAGRHLGGRAS